MASIENIHQKVSRLQDEDCRLSTLQEMKQTLESISRDEVTKTANNLNLPLVFDCLNDSNTEQVDLACDVLTICMSNLSLGESTNRYGVFLERALNHPYTSVKLMALKEIGRNAKTDEVLATLCKNESLLGYLIRCVADQNLAVAKAASDIITIVGKSKTGIKQLTSDHLLLAIREVMKNPEVVRLRAYEIFINISAVSEYNFNMIQATGLIAQLVNELDNDDVLLRLDILELLTVLGLTKHGFDFLESNEILNKVSSYFDSEYALGIQLIEPGILKFFGSIAHWKPLQIMSKYPNLFNRLFTNLSSTDYTIVGVTLDTIGYIGTLNEGKVALNSKGEEMDDAIKFMAKSLGSYPTDIKIRALNCLENLLKVSERDKHAIQITHKWFKLMHDNPIELISNYAKNPFPEIRLGGLGVFVSLAGQTWGQEAIKNTPGLVEFLLDRNVETTKESKEVKFAIVELLAVSSIFDKPTTNKLRDFVKEGPFYVHTITEIMVEGND